MAGELAGRVILVTGGSRGIGRACAESALAAGARVLLAARGAAGLEATRRELAAKHGAEVVAAEPADVAVPADADRLVDAALGRLDGLDGLVHAAAVQGPIGPTLDVDPDEWLDALRLDLYGTFLLARAVGRSLRERRVRGSMVLLSGGGATSPFPNYTAYACGKAGVVRLAETLAVELAPLSIRVNALAPGFVATGIHKATLEAGERAGKSYLEQTRRRLAGGAVPAALAADAAVFLLSDRSDGITGRLLAAPWDDWRRWPERRDEIGDGDLFTLRRIVPRDRGGDWQ